MRGIFLIFVILTILIRTIGAPQAGILGWTWLTLMTPQKLAWGPVAELSLNLAVAVVTFLAWFLSRERKQIPINGAILILFAFMVYMTFTTLFALAPDLAWPRWSLAIKVMVLGLMVASIMTTQIRIHSLIWVISISLGYYGIKGGIFTLLTGGHFRVLAPPESFGDNNALALALCMVLPLMNYLRLQSSNQFVRHAMVAAMGLTAIGVLGTYSRGGLIGLTIMSIYLWWHSKNRIAVAVIVLAFSVPAYEFMPANWTERMETIHTADEDSSFQDRVSAWRTALNMATARPFTGGGFNATLSQKVYQIYNANPSFGGARAAHSIYFEVLGDHGFIGLILYLALLIATWRYAGTTRKKARDNPRFEWVEDLAAMIQVSLITFAVAGAALSMAYYDTFYLLLGITSVLRNMVLQPDAKAETVGQTLPITVG